MKSLALLTGVLALASAAAAFPHKPESKSPSKKMHCAVMASHEINVKDAEKKKAYSDYKGNRYYFCCSGCIPDFKKNPEKYAKNDHVPTPKKKG
jgi:YHS domain-containing protein